MGEREVDEVLARDTEWAAHALAGKDVNLILSYWTDDAVVIPPGWPVLAGREAIRPFVEAMLSDTSKSFSWRSDQVAMSDDASTAYLIGPNFVVTQGADGETREEAGRGVTVWRREDGGVWRCAVDIWNSE